MNTPKWIVYNDLAWTERIVALPEDYTEEAELYVRLLRERAAAEPKTLLHLGCGAGGHDFTFKRHFRVTGVDISEGMLEVARETNPEIRYIHGDMRSVVLDERFDAVVIPDSIGYMTTEEDLRTAVRTAASHLKPGGALLITVNMKEEFRDNNFVYTGSKGNIEIVVFENNYVPASNPATYEATIVTLIRRSGVLETYAECHTLGLFPTETWLRVLQEAGFETTETRLDDLYAPFIQGDGAYPLRVFVGVKRT
jgi:ubiquinone/menaquinone biosynthesis C-methylase UbiE